MESTCIALIPAYEPGRHMLPLIKQARLYGMEVIVVDDGSEDAFAEQFREAAAFSVVLTHRRNAGKGRALKTGMAYIMEHFQAPYVVVTLDADGQHTVPDALKVCRAAREAPEALALGSRRLGSRVPLRSSIGNTLTRWVYCLCTGVRVHDTQTGLRAFSSRLVPALLEIPGERYEYEMNMLLACARKQIPIREIGIKTIYIGGNEASHFDALRDSCRIYKEIFKFSLSSLLCFFIDYALYSLLLAVTAGLGGKSLFIANIAARLVSASVNYAFNRKLVFQSEGPARRSAVRYAALAAAVLLCNTAVLGILTGRMGMDRFAAKLCTEILVFFFSFFIQRAFVFRQGKVRRSPERGG